MRAVPDTKGDFPERQSLPSSPALLLDLSLLAQGL